MGERYSYARNMDDVMAMMGMVASNNILGTIIPVFVITLPMTSLAYCPLLHACAWEVFPRVMMEYLVCNWMSREGFLLFTYIDN